MRAKATVILSVRVAPWVKDAAEQAAADRGQTLKDFLETLVTEATDRPARAHEPASAA
jgi:hypothetical protein